MTAATTKTPGQDRLTKTQIAIMFAVILASIMTGFYTRLFQTALPDLRGIWGLSVDQGAWLNTAALAPQMLVAPVVPWLVVVFGVRPVMLPAALAFIFLTFMTPFITGYIPLLVAHALIGGLIGCFITATILILVRTVPMKWWLLPLAFYGFRIGLTINTGISVSALYTEFLGWQWIYWQSGLLMLVYIAIIYVCVPPTGCVHQMLKNVDISGMLFFCLGTTLIYIGMDQGERLGWFDAGFITVCLGGGGTLLAGFILNSLIVPVSWATPKVLLNRSVLITFLLTGVFGFVFMGNAMLITQFLETIHSLKPLQTGQALLAIAGTQLVLIPASVWLTKRVDPRLTFAAGLLCFALGCRLGASATMDWVALDFLSVGVFFAFGLPLCFMSIMILTISAFDPQKAPSILAIVQIFRVLIPSAAGAVVSLYIRLRRDTHTLFLSERMAGNDHTVTTWIDHAGSGALSSLASMIKTKASVLAFQDTFHLCFWVAVGGLVLLVLQPSPDPTPLYAATPVTPAVSGQE